MFVWTISCHHSSLIAVPDLPSNGCFQPVAFIGSRGGEKFEMIEWGKHIFRSTFAAYCEVARPCVILPASWFRCNRFSSYKIKQRHRTSQIHFHPRPVLRNNSCDRDIAAYLALLAHSKLPPNHSFSSSEYVFAVHLSVASTVCFRDIKYTVTA